MLDEWIKSRSEVKGKITHWKQAKRPIEWPPRPEFDPMYWCGEVYRTELAMRSEMKLQGLGYLNWQRPASCELPVLTPEGGGWYLLAIGEVVEMQWISVPRY